MGQAAEKRKLADELQADLGRTEIPIETVAHEHPTTPSAIQTEAA